MPALAVADALRAEGSEAIFIGADRAETQLVPAAGYELRRLAVKPLPRSSGRLTAGARATVTDGAAVARALALLRELRPAAVLGAGGYVAGPTGLAATALRVPLVLMEADSYMGLTNRLLAPFARRVCLAFPIRRPGGTALSRHGQTGADPGD